tara:strand:+ start:2646 stop:3191 length:546 start_codon:yes stop_codon:yes gene_type:complete
LNTTTDVTIKIGALEMTLTNLPITEELIVAPVITETPVRRRRKKAKTTVKATKSMAASLDRLVLDMDPREYNGARGADTTPRKIIVPKGLLQDQVLAVLLSSKHKRGMELKQLHERVRTAFPKVTMKSLAGVMKVLHDNERVFRSKVKGGKFKYKHPQNAAGSFTWLNKTNAGTLDGEVVG